MIESTILLLLLPVLLKNPCLGKLCSSVLMTPPGLCRHHWGYWGPAETVIRWLVDRLTQIKGQVVAGANDGKLQKTKRYYRSSLLRDKNDEIPWKSHEIPWNANDHWLLPDPHDSLGCRTCATRSWANSPETVCIGWGETHTVGIVVDHGIHHELMTAFTRGKGVSMGRREIQSTFLHNVIKNLV